MHTLFRGLGLPPFSGVTEMLGFFFLNRKCLDSAQNLSHDYDVYRRHNPLNFT